MANFNLDRFKFRWRGEWKTNADYRKDDIVYYQGKSFVCLEGHTSSANFYDEFLFDNKDESFLISVGADSINAQSQGKFYIDQVEAPKLFLLKGRTYVFNQNNPLNSSYEGSLPSPLFFSNVRNGTLVGGSNFVDGVVYRLDDQIVTVDEYIEGFAAASSRLIEVTLTDNSPDKLFYFSANNLDMGGEITTKYSSYWELMTDGQIWLGDWNINTFYAEGSIVKYKGNTYQAISSHTSGPSFQDGIAGDINNWILYVKHQNWLNTWSTSTYYDIGDVVRYNGRTYICSIKHESADTESAGREFDDGKWELVTRSDNWRQDWQYSTRYIQDDVVKYGGIVYRCLVGHTSAENTASTLGLEINQDLWETVISGLDYKTDWSIGSKYKVGDIVKYGSSLWRCVSAHISGVSPDSFREDENNWEIFIPGLEYDVEWNTSTEYQKGDIVRYGGYSYIALENNANSVPSVNGKLQDTGNWELVKTGFLHKVEWDSATLYKPGEVIRYGGDLYVCTKDVELVQPDSDAESWALLVDGTRWRAEWNDNTEYLDGDVVVYRGTTYQCIDRHLSTASLSRPDDDLAKPVSEFWNLLIQGSPNNVLTDVGDIKIYSTENINLAIGSAGETLSISSNTPLWRAYNKIPKTFYVSLEGTDEVGFGETPSSPFRTIKFACEYILQDEESRAPATIKIDTGEFKEELPIRVPARVALVGDELRSTRVAPADGFEQSNMFYVRNGSGIRNMTLTGLSGELGSLNEFLTRRPSAGAYVSLDPGTGPDDESVWITSKSCYVQNVTTFGEGCIGMKVDGGLHNGGNRSIVANDFTQILSNGIGYWADRVGRSELVSVFTYYAHIGYLCTNGGILRATNGNNSYGDFGSVAEGFDETETPIAATINNRDNDAQFFEGVTYGTTLQEVIAVGYSHAGQDYTAASIDFGGSGIGADAYYNEFRDGAISNIRVTAPGDSTTPGGLNYTAIANNAQSGSRTNILLAQADTEEDPARYIGQRIRIANGQGVGQYAEITDFDPTTKRVVVTRESDGSNGWDHFFPGWPIENQLDETSRYVIEPRVDVTEPAMEISPAGNLSGGTGWQHVATGASEIIAITDGEDGSPVASISSDDGANWTNPASIGAGPISGIVYTGSNYIVIHKSQIGGATINSYVFSTNGTFWNAGSLPVPGIWNSVASDGSGTVATISSADVVYSTDSGTSWNLASITDATTENFELLSYGNGRWVALDNGSGNIAVSTNLEDWTLIEQAITPRTYTDITYGNGRFAAIAEGNGSPQDPNFVVYSFNGTEWYEGRIEQGTFTNISYGAGVFIASGPGNLVARSQSCEVWRTFNDDSTAFITSADVTWTDNVYTGSKWVIIPYDGGNVETVTTGARPVIRLDVSNSRANKFVIYDPGSNYSTVPDVTIYDNLNTIDATYTVFLRNGVLAQPEYSDRGNGYTAITASILGNGFAEIFQLGNEIKVSGLTNIPGPGANLDIAGIDDRQYNISRVNSFSGDEGEYDAVLRIVPSLGVDESPEHGTAFSIRERYSQVRLTGHDFLDIGTGNFNTTRYPDLYLEGEESINARQPFNETVASGGGRVFYTSTDQDGNFRVGELFEVEQSRGVVTVNAEFFDLQGLDELSLGGIQVGGSAVVIREFSKDPTFVANSNNIVPTQRAIKRYIESRISGGGANASTNTLIAGQVQISSNNFDTTSGFQINVPVKMTMLNGIDGQYLASQFFNL